MIKVKYVNIPTKFEYEFRELNKILVIDKNLNETKQQILGDYGGENELVGKLSIGDQFRETHVIFRNITDYEACFNAIDGGYEASDAIFNGYFCTVNTPHVNLVNRSQYGNGCDFKHEISEYRDNICFVPTKGYCFVNCINIITGEDYKQQ